MRQYLESGKSIVTINDYRKLHKSFQLTPRSTTLDDLKLL